MQKTELILLLPGLALVTVFLLNPRPQQPDATGPVVFEVVTFQPMGKHIPRNLMMFTDAVRSSQIDTALTSPGYYSNLAPLSHINVFSNRSYSEGLSSSSTHTILNKPSRNT